MISEPRTSILIPSRGRAGYLDVTLGSVAPQARELGAEVLVVNDGGDPGTTAVADRHGASVLQRPVAGGLNAARNAGIGAARGDLLVLIDDDVRAPADWLSELLAGVRRAPDRDVFGGPIRAVLEGGGPRSCGRESAPITTLDLGPDDRDVAFVWGANMAIRRRAFEAVGPFDESIAGRGDEEDWERRHAARGGRVRYVARAGLEHRRTAADATLRRLSGAAYALGRTARANDVRKHAAPPVRSEIRVLLGCAGHIVRYRCANGAVMAAHSAGRLREALAR